MDPVVTVADGDKPGDFHLVTIESRSKTEIVGALEEAEPPTSPVPSITIASDADAAPAPTGPSPVRTPSPVDPDDAVSRFLKRRSASNTSIDPKDSDSRRRSPSPGRDRFGSSSKREQLSVESPMQKSNSDDEGESRTWRAALGRRRSGNGGSTGSRKSGVCCLQYSSKGLSQCAECGKKW